MQSFLELSQVRPIADGDDLDVTVFGIADPAAKVESGSFAVNEPAKSDALDAAFDEVVVDHGAWSVWQMMGWGARLATPRDWMMRSLRNGSVNAIPAWRGGEFRVSVGVGGAFVGVRGVVAVPCDRLKFLVGPFGFD